MYLHLISSRIFASLLLVLSFWFPAATISAQQTGPVSKWLDDVRAVCAFQPIALFTPSLDRSDLENTVSNAVLLQVDENAADALLHEAPKALLISLPLEDGSNMDLELAKVEILAPEFSVGTKGINAQEHFPVHNGVHYRGIVQGQPGTLAALSITSSGISGMVADEEGTRELGMMEDGSRQYVFYKTQNLRALPTHTCFSEDLPAVTSGSTEDTPEDRGIGCKTVNIYFECDYKLYADKGYSTNNVTNYVTSLFNQIATLYSNENVGVAISQIYVWTSQDPYVSMTSTASVLNAFRQTLGTSFNGNLAHFLSTRSLGGGIAYVDVICFKQYAFGVSAISTSFQNVPTYSWSVEVVTHELGHNLGSWHTQSCNWPNGPIDNCVSPEGSCAPGPPPVNGGTIMSYCHLTGYGINFNHGFGPVPGAKIRDKVLNATCLTATGTAPGGLAATNITSVSASLQWGAVAGATNYTVQYKPATSNTWTPAGSTAATTFNLNNLSSSTAYNWQVKTDCSAFSASSNFSTLGSNSGGGGGGSSCSAPVSLIATNITSNSAVLSWAAVSGASQYTVEYKTSSSGTWLTAGTAITSAYNLGGLSASTTYNWRVKANCSGYSGVSTFSTTGSGGGNCNPPTYLFNNQVYVTSASLSWTPVSGATSYTLQLKLASSSTYFTLGSVPYTSVTLNGLQPGTSYHWRVKANCSVYSSPLLLTTLPGFTGGGDNALQGAPSIEINEQAAYRVFPNPASGKVFVHSANPLLPGAKVFITNMIGANVMEAEWSEAGFDVTALNPGVYALQIMENGKRLFSEKLIIVR